MKRLGARGKKGFALPTVMIASVVMLIVLLSGLVSASSANTAIRDQYKQKTMQMAADAGVAMVNACLSKSYNVGTWAGKTLRPNTDCDGNTIAGSAFVMDTPTLKTTFEIPDLIYENGTQRASVNVKMTEYRATSGTQVMETSEVHNALIGTQNSFSTVTFGYLGGASVDTGAQFAVVLGTGEVKTAGRNNNGRLGNGTFTDTSVPSTFILPVNERGIAAFSNFLSVGRQLSVITANGKVFSAGTNSTGQLGNGTTTPSVATPVQFGALGNSAQPKAKFVTVSNLATFVMADNNRIYAAGDCASLLLGNGCTSGIVANPVQVSLPTPTSDLNTQPEPLNDWVQSTNFTTDRINTYVRMKGGAMYGWGGNDYGQLGDGTFTNRATPVRIQALTSSITPSADQIAFNGNSFYVLDTNGLVWAVGENSQYGELGGTGAIVRNGGNTAVCLQKDPGSSNLLVTACSTGDGMQWMEFWPDGTWRFRSNSGGYRQTDPTLCATAPSTLSSTSYVQMLACTGAANQQWQFRSDKTIYSPFNNGCAEPYANVYMVSCRATTDGLYPYQQWSVQNSPYLRPMPVPPGNPKATRISTDNGGIVILYENGDVWAAGSNNRNQLGIGTSYLSVYNPVLRKVPLPGPAADIYATDYDPTGPSTGVNMASYNNSFFVLRSGAIYGTGADNFGQLGRGGTITGDYVSTPMLMQLPPGVLAKSVQSAYGTTVVISSTGKIFTVGNNSHGQLGNGNTSSSSIPEAHRYTNQRTTISY